MDHTSEQLFKIKTQWFSGHVDVEFPTKESLLGRELFLSRASNPTCYQLNTLPSVNTEYQEGDVFKVDFHRLTIMFSLLQAQNWDNEKEQALVLEFLSQIIFSEPCDLYVGFLSGEPSAAAVVTKSGDSILVSDIVTKSNKPEHFLAALVHHNALDIEKYANIYIESYQ